MNKEYHKAKIKFHLERIAKHERELRELANRRQTTPYQSKLATEDLTSTPKRDPYKSMCKKCGGVMAKASYIKNTPIQGLDDFIGQDTTNTRGQTMHYGGGGTLIKDGMKCILCGWSTT